MTTDEFIDRLNEDLSTEYQSIVQYNLHIATITGARIYLDMEAAGEDFSTWIWTMAGGKPIQGKRKGMADIPAKTPLSEEISAALKKRGFKFVGPVIVYAWLQACGIVDDHITTCFRASPNPPKK